MNPALNLLKMDSQEVEILLIEDNEDDAELTIRALNRNNIGNKITHLKDGVEAMEFLLGKGEYEGRDTGNKPRLILLDLKMPRVNGIEVLKQIKENDSIKEIPIVVLTSSKEDPDIKQCYLYGANSYIVKPVDSARFREAIASLGMYWMLVNHPPH